MGLKAPFPWFGGKSRIASLAWERFGNVGNYVEPFAGSLAVLLGRPEKFPPRVETVNDKDAYLANFWRALQHDPEQVAHYADWPVNETDLHARHRWLVDEGRAVVDRLLDNPEVFDARIAGWWVWGQCLWIGSGWCAAPEWTGRGHAASGNRGIHNKRFAGTGNGQGTGIHRRWNGGGQGGGSGVHAPTLTKQLPQLSGERSGAARGLLREAVRSEGLFTYLTRLSIRLRRVRVCCGDWRRVLTPSVTTYIGVTAVLLDPPYRQADREICYSEDHEISADVRAWALEHGDDPKLRIALCGYDGEHDMPASWSKVAWKAHGGYSRTKRGRENRERERVWFSPHCRPAELPILAGLSA